MRVLRISLPAGVLTGVGAVALLVSGWILGDRQIMLGGGVMALAFGLVTLIVTRSRSAISGLPRGQREAIEYSHGALSSAVWVGGGIALIGIGAFAFFDGARLAGIILFVLGVAAFGVGTFMWSRFLLRQLRRSTSTSDGRHDIQ